MAHGRVVDEEEHKPRDDEIRNKDEGDRVVRYNNTYGEHCIERVKARFPSPGSNAFVDEQDQEQDQKQLGDFLPRERRHFGKESEQKSDEEGGQEGDSIARLFLEHDEQTDRNEGKQERIDRLENPHHTHA